jgi:hypothetical protein
VVVGDGGQLAAVISFQQKVVIDQGLATAAFRAIYRCTAARFRALVWPAAGPVCGVV